MFNNLSSKDLIKYMIVIGILYTILKILPSQKLSSKDILLLLFVIMIIFVTIDYKCFKDDQSESFIGNLSNPIDKLQSSDK